MYTNLLILIGIFSIELWKKSNIRPHAILLCYYSQLACLGAAYTALGGIFGVRTREIFPVWRTPLSGKYPWGCWFVRVVIAWQRAVAFRFWDVYGHHVCAYAHVVWWLLCVCVCVCMYVCMRVCTYVVCVAWWLLCVYVCMCACMYIRTKLASPSTTPHVKHTCT